MSQSINKMSSTIAVILLIACVVTLGESKGNVFVSNNANKTKTAQGSGYIVLFKSKKGPDGFGLLSRDEVEERAEDLGKKYNLENDEIFVDAIQGFSANNLTKSDVANLKKEEDVRIVEKNVLFSLDPFEDGVAVQSKWELCGTQQVPPNIKYVGWENVENRFSNKRVFVVDTGIANMPEEFKMDTGMGRSFVGGGWDDCHGHGTHVAGIIGAKNNNCGVVGVAAGITLVPIKVVDCNGNGDLSGVVQALNYIYQVAERGDVVNMSLGSKVPQKSMDIAVSKLAKDKGVQFALAAGNDNSNAVQYTPARVNAPGVYTVCATQGYSGQMKFATFSNYGSPVDICAPGKDIISLAPNGRRWKRSGTSMAAPHVAGLLALEKLGSSNSVKFGGQTYKVAKK